MSMKATEKLNALPNTYIPSYSTESLITILDRLSTESLYQLCIHWTKSVNTQPYVPKDSIYTQQGLCNKLIKEIKSLLRNTHSGKTDIIRKITYEYWSDGLNLLQLAQIDCQLIIDGSGHFYWHFSRILDVEGNEFCLDVDPQLFAQDVASKLSKLYFTYVYILKHPRLSLHIIKIQVFDLNQKDGLLDPDKPQVSSYRPYFICLPTETTYIFHSVSHDDVVCKLIMQTIEQCLPTHEQNQLKLDTPSDQKPIASLETIYTLKGSSRLGKTLGIWSPYADGVIDIAPLGVLDKHSTLQEHSNDKEDTIEAKLQDIASLRFHGVTNDVNSPNRGSKKRQFAAIDESEANSSRSHFASRIPLQHAEFVIQEPMNQSTLIRSNIKLKLSGTDVFGGLHELSVATSDSKKMIINPEEIPHWLTGEDGATFGHIRDGKFHS